MAEQKYIIPAWYVIKMQTLESFYKCSELLKEFRKIIVTKDSPIEINEQRSQIWTSFVSELINLFMINRSTIKTNSKTQEHYTKLEELEKYFLKIDGLQYKKAVDLFVTIEQALFKIGMLDLSLERDDDNPEEAYKRGIDM